MSPTDPLSIRQLEVFVALIEQGSFTRAAQSLHLSQSTVSGHVADLERRLGVRLVERDRSGVRPTAAGDALLRPARDVLRAERGARMAVQELSGLLSGSLLVGGSTIPASYLLPTFFARFHERYPAVSLQLVTGDSRGVTDQVLAAEVEVGIVGAPPKNPQLLSDKVGQDELVLVTSAEHPLAGKREWDTGDLAECPLVMREQGSGTRTATNEALRGLLGADGLGSLRVACEVGSTEALKAAVRSGLGAAFVSSLAVGDELEGGSLVAVHLGGFRVTRDFHLISRKEPLLSPAAVAFRTIALG